MSQEKCDICGKYFVSVATRSCVGVGGLFVCSDFCASESYNDDKKRKRVERIV